MQALKVDVTEPAAPCMTGSVHGQIVHGQRIHQ